MELIIELVKQQAKKAEEMQQEQRSGLVCIGKCKKDVKVSVPNRYPKQFGEYCILSCKCQIEKVYFSSLHNNY